MREEQEVRSPQECLTAQEKKQEMSGIRSGGEEELLYRDPEWLGSLGAGRDLQLRDQGPPEPIAWDNALRSG